MWNKCYSDLNVLRSVTPICYEYQSIDEIQKESLESFTHLCWKTYSPRLKNISENIARKGNLEYQLTNKKILELVLKIGYPIKSSLSVTLDGSLHYSFFFDNSYTLFIETFIHLDEGNSTYLEFFYEDDLLYSSNDEVEVGINRIFNAYIKKNKYLFKSEQSSNTELDKYKFNTEESLEKC